MAPSEWFKALYEENCMRVLELLKAHPHLLGEGLREDYRRVFEGSSIWKGRTALHVGARRGSVKLVKAVLGLFEEETYSGVELGDLLIAKDGWYKLDAMAMAVVHGNRDIILILANESLLRCEMNPYEVSSGWEVPIGSPSLTTSRMQLRKITVEVMESLEKSRSANAEHLKALYSGNRDFNFLPWEEFLFHFTFLKWSKQRTLYLDEASYRAADRQRALDEVRHNIFDRTRSSPDLRRFLCELQDGQGRTALHIAVDEGTVLRFLVLIPKDSLSLLNAADGTGKVALHRAAALDNPESLRLLMDDGRMDLQALYCPWEYTERLWTTLGIDMERLSRSNGGKDLYWFDNYDFMNALHIAIIHKRRDCVRLLLDDKYTQGTWNLDVKYPFTRIFLLRNGERRRLGLEPLQLAAVVGDASILEILLQSKGIRDPGRPSHWPTPTFCNLSSPWPALHLVAASGKFESLKLFIDNKNYDVTVEDLDQNTTLHHATKGREFHFSAHSVDCISCEDAVEWSVDENGSQARERKEDVERQGCIELLLQVGFDIWKTNQSKQAPYMGRDASAEILSWWYEKVAKETIAQQNTLNSACNAMSVTATLVATASFQGPLQPPLGWSTGSDQLQVRNLPIRVFIVCDTLSFYFAVAAIMSALIPSLPMPQESMMDELRRTRRMVTIAVGFLFPSIVSILIAFAAASIAVIPDNQPSWNGGGLTITTASIGGLVCFGVICLFFVRLLRLIFYRNVQIRTLFKATTF